MGGLVDYTVLGGRGGGAKGMLFTLSSKIIGGGCSSSATEIGVKGILTTTTRARRKLLTI